MYSERVMPEHITLTTPENIELKFPVAGLYSRGLAQFYDFVYQCIALVVGSTVLLTLGVSAGMFWALYAVLTMFLYFAVLWLYYIYYEVYNDGQTPGKRRLGIRVVMLDGGRIGWAAAIARNLLRPIDFLPIGFLAGMASILVSKHHQRLGDLAAGTIVIRDAESLPARPGTDA